MTNPNSAYTPNKGLELPANGDYVNSWNGPVNSDFTVIDTCFGGLNTFNATVASGTVPITATYGASGNGYIPPIWIITGTPTANVNYQLPARVGGRWSVYNNTSGANTITVSSATGGGASVVIPQGQRLAICCDGTNVTADSTVVPSGAQTWTGAQTISIGVAASGGNYLLLRSTDWGAGKPELFFQKDGANLANWFMGAYDGTGDNGTLTLQFSSVSTSASLATGALVATGAISASGAISAGGAISSPSAVQAGSGANGSIQIDSGDTAHTGYVAFFLPSGQRQGYVGWVNSGGPINIENDLGNGFSFTGGNVSMPSFTVTSDRRLKSDIAPLTGAGELIDVTNTYAYTKGGERQWGVIAQEVRESAPLLVREGANGMLEVDYLGFVAALIAEVRSLRGRVAALEAAK